MRRSGPFGNSRLRWRLAQCDGEKGMVHVAAAARCAQRYAGALASKRQVQTHRIVVKTGSRRTRSDLFDFFHVLSCHRKPIENHGTAAMTMTPINSAIM